MANYRGDFVRLLKFEAAALALLLCLSAVLWFVPAAWALLPAWAQLRGVLLLVALLVVVPVAMLWKWAVSLVFDAVAAGFAAIRKK